MLKWGHWNDIDVGILHDADQLLRRQSKAVEEDTRAASFTPASILTNDAINRGIRVQQQQGPVDAFGALGLTFFFLGYLYHVGEEGQLQRLAEMLFGDEKQGGADESDGSVRRDGAGDHRPPEADRA